MAFSFEKIASNLQKIDTQKDGIFFMSYNTPIAMIKGKDEFMTTASYSTSTGRHKSKLLGEHIIRNNTPISAEELGKKCKEAGINCDY